MTRGNAGLPMELAPRGNRHSAPTPRRKSSRKKYLKKTRKAKSAPLIRNKTRKSSRKNKKHRRSVRSVRSPPRKSNAPSQSTINRLKLYQNPSPQLARKLQRSMDKTKNSTRRRKAQGMKRMTTIKM